MDYQDICYLELNEVAQLIHSGAVTSVEVTKMQIERIANAGNHLNAYILVTDELALKQAADADAEIAAGNIKSPLHGVPIAAKDIFDLAGVATTAGMRIHQHAIAKTDSTVMRRLQDAGAVILGKLNMAEGVFGEHFEPYGVPINPWDDKLYSGASSSGSGVAAASGLCYAAISSDTGGSIRIPCATSGVTGLKPTWGRVSRYGVFELAASLDHVGVIARSALDVGIVLGIMAGADEMDSTASQLPVPDYPSLLNDDLSDLKIGVDREWITKDVNSSISAAVYDALDVLSSLGASIVDIEFPNPDQIVEDWYSVCAVQSALAHRETFPSRRDQYGPALEAVLDHGLNMTGLDYQEVLLRREEFAGRVQKLFQSIDLIACPSIAFPVPSLEKMQFIDDEIIHGLHRFTCSFTMSRNPTITMPGGFNEALGVPEVVQFVGAHFAEGLLVRVGHAFQQATNWNKRRPFG